jgi:hypothetical protein
MHALPSGRRRLLAFALACSIPLAGSPAALAGCSAGDREDVDVPDAGAVPTQAAPPAASTTTPPPSPAAEPPPAAASDAGADAARPDASTTASSYCEFRTTECSKSPSSCQEERACFAAMRDGVGASIERCVVDSDRCNYVDDCLGRAAKKVLDGNAPPVRDFASACLAKLGACGEEAALDDGDCRNLVVFPDAALTTLRACIDRPCASVGACVAAELARRGCDG